MSETTSRATGAEPTEAWFHDMTRGMPGTPDPAHDPVPTGPPLAGGSPPPGGDSLRGEPGRLAFSGAPAAVPTAGSGGDAAPGGTAPALRQPHWSGKKTAVAAALAIGLSAVGGVGAAAYLRDGGGSAVDGPGAGIRPGQFPGGQAPNGQFPGGQAPNGQSNQHFPGQLTQPLGPPGDDDLDDSATHDDSSSPASASRGGTG